jgi:hypothetical protein
MSKNSFELQGRVGDFEFLTYFSPIITVPGTVLCTLCIIIFSHSASFSPKLYKFLKYESIFITCNLVIKSFSPIVYCKTCPVSTTLFSCVYFIYFLVYASSICEMSALVCNVLSALFCLLHISKLKMQKPVKPSPLFVLININHRILALVTAVFAACLYCYQLFQFEIVIRSRNDNSTTFKIYVVQQTNFYYSELNTVIEIISHTIRDGLNLVILIVINTLLLLKIRKKLKQNSPAIPARHSSTVNAKNCDETISRSVANNMPASLNRLTPRILNEKKVTKLIVINCLNSIVGRLPILVYFILRNLSNSSILIEFLGAFSFFSVYFCYFTKFFLFYFSNSKFREQARLLFRRFKCDRSS